MMLQKSFDSYYQDKEGQLSGTDLARNRSVDPNKDIR